MEPSQQPAQAPSTEAPQTAAPAPAPAPPAQPAAEAAKEANPFKAQMEQAQKEWAESSKPKEEPKPPAEAAVSSPAKKPETEASEVKKIIDAKNAAIKKAKTEILQLQEKLQNKEEEYNKFIANKDEAAAAKTLGKYEALKEEYEAAIKKETTENFFQEVETKGEVQNIETFREQAEYYIPLIAKNPAIEQILHSTQYPFATMELLFNTMADKGWSAEKLAEQPMPTLKMWLGAVGREAAAIIEGKKTQPPATAAQPPVPPSVVATTSSDPGTEPAIKTEGASMRDIIQHVRKYGGKGIK